MNYYDQRSRSRFTSVLDNNALVMLIAIHLVVFVLFSFINVFYFFSFEKEIARVHFYQDIYTNLAIPAGFREFLHKPWTLLTHMFYHFEVWHLISNMIWLWMFGYILHDLTGNNKIIPIFLYGGLGGAVAFMLVYNLIPALHADIEGVNAVGGSAGVMAVAIATTMIAPGFRLFPFINGGIPLWVLTMIFVIIDLAALPINNHGGHIAHIGGALTGYLFIVLYRRGYDGSEWMNNFYDWFTNIFNPDKPKKKNTIKDHLFYKSRRAPYEKTMNLTQQRIDEILDKINQKGYGSLTSEEKELLKRASKEDL
ncbi:MAG: rhomboid family intramembrane serine protease [Terrimonas sp.]|nr:rhomboid family intramembrane serine protease [Terrimonas sp.]